MGQDANNEAWSRLDGQALHGLLSEGPEPLFATVSRVRLYRFASPNSDLDLRYAFVLPTRGLLRLRPPDETRIVDRVLDADEHTAERNTIERRLEEAHPTGGLPEAATALRVAETERLDFAMKTAAAASKLPANVDHAALDKRLFGLLAEFCRPEAPDTRARKRPYPCS